MCTLTWWQEDSRYSLFFNRDEQKTRLPASHPELRHGNGVRFLTPIDGNRGGTWILANEYGLSIALLNFYDAAIDLSALPAKSPSRGHLVLSLADSPNLDALASALAEHPLGDYWPFHLFAIAPAARPRLYTWGGPGSTLETNPDPVAPITTSSFRTAEVCARRRESYLAITGNKPTPERLEEYHQQNDPDDGASSVRMRRPDAQTLSYSRIDVDETTINFTYRPDPLDSLDLNEPRVTTLPLRTHP